MGYYAKIQKISSPKYIRASQTPVVRNFQLRDRDVSFAHIRGWAEKVHRLMVEFGERAGGRSGKEVSRPRRFFSYDSPWLKMSIYWRNKPQPHSCVCVLWDNICIYIHSLLFLFIKLKKCVKITSIKILPKMPRMWFEPTPYEWRTHRCIDHSATAWIASVVLHCYNILLKYIRASRRMITCACARDKKFVGNKNLASRPPPPPSQGREMFAFWAWKKSFWCPYGPHTSSIGVAAFGFPW